MNFEELFTSVRQGTESLCKPLFVEDYIPQPVEFVSPPKWHLAHTTWFFEEFLLKPFHKNYKEYNKDFAFLFNSYYVSVGERMARNQRGLITRPTVEEIYKYRSHVDAAIQSFFKTNLTKEQAELIVLGLNHEQQHQELLITDLKYTFSLNPTFPIYTEDALCMKGSVGSSKFITLNAGVHSIGHEGENFAYDNEMPKHQVYLHEFSIRHSLVSNAEYIDFILADGYKNFDLWHSEGWAWLEKNSVSFPMYWRQMDNKWFQYTLAGLKEIIPDNPVTHINYYEAYAFAQWKNMRLPTEFEWEAASDKFNWGERWEWTESAYLPYPGFKKAPGAVGEYNGKFMVNQKVLRGASVATSEGHQRHTYRNFFHPELAWQYTGIRLAK